MNSMERTDIVPVDLQGYNDFRLNSAGELEMSPTFEHAIHFEVGDDELELTRVSAPTDDPDANPWKPESLFVLRNLSSSSPEAVVIMDNVQRLGNIVIKGVEYQTQQGSGPYVIGRATTPELELSQRVSDEHLKIRIGSLAGYIHFSDMDTESGTVAKLHERDARLISSPRRQFVRVEPGAPLMTREEQRQRWSR